MNNSTDAKARIESAERMLREAKANLNKDDTEEALEFLRSAGRHIERAIKALEPAEPAVHVVRGHANAVIPREVASHARG